MTYFDIDTLDPKRIYKLLTSVVVPRPIAWTVTRSASGNLNAAPFSFFNFFSGAPPVVGLGLGDRDGSPKDTLANLRATGEAVIHIVTPDLVDAMNTTAVPFSPDVDEIEIAGLATEPCRKVSLPRIAASPVALECRLWKVIDLDASSHLALVHVLAVHVLEDAVTDVARCYIDGARLTPLGRMQSPGWYTRTEDRFLLRQLSTDDWRAKNERKPRQTN